MNTDTEIETTDEDRLGRTPFCRRVVERIVAAGDGPSVVFGLAGPWGAGKTSVLNIVSALLTEDHGQKWAVVRFTAWSASNVEALTNEFYQAIAAAMPQNTKEGQKAVGWLLSMAPVLAAASKAAATSVIEAKLGKDVLGKTSEATVDAIADRIGKLRIEPDPFITRFKKMSEAIDQAERNVLVVVDDIDRLHTDELLGVMKAVRLLGRFNRVHYILSYDQQTVLDVLQASDIANNDEKRARHYLEKIVQYPFVLPPLQISQVEAELDAALHSVANAHGIDLEPSGSGRWGTIPRIIHALPDRELEQLTLRRINRLASQVEVVLTLVGARDLNFIDTVLVTFIRLAYPALYDRLPQWQSDLITDARVTPYSVSHDSVTDADWAKRIADALAIKPDDGVNGAELEAVARLMSTLFPGAFRKGGMRLGDETCRIDSRDYFPRYFALSIPTGDVSDATVRSELATLVSSGKLPSDSAVLAMLTDARGAALVLRKVLRVVDVITESRAGKPAAAAGFLNSVLREGDRLFGRWGTVIQALLIRAVDDAETTAEARRVVDEFAENAGLLATAEVLYGSAPQANLDPATLRAASKAIESGIVEACHHDLTRDLVAENSEALTCLHFWRFWSGLPQDVINQLAAKAETLVSDGAAKAHELAGRFVSVPTVAGSPSPLDSPAFFNDVFETLVPRDRWRPDELAHHSQVEIIDGDRSLENRSNFAAQEMQRLLATQPDSSS
ncbi:KAP family P-loop NTPase fold protein [Mycolicibacter algericus]|uniref:KAP family P-loop NTPase fold protein n=1 Tax=Mycolicibacter algericus TaxID=1288388 RepID=UPI003C75621F